MERRSFHDEQSRNKRDSILLAVVVSAVLLALIVSISYMFDPSSVVFMVPLGIMFTGIYTWSSYQYGDKVVLMSTNAQLAEGNRYIFLNDTVEGLAIAAGIPKPDVYVMPSSELNAYATGKDPEHSSIAVTQGLIDTLDRQELEGVIAHEISHIRNRDVQFMTLVAVLVGIAGILSHMINGSIDVLILGIGFLLAIFAPILSRLVQMAVSRSREYLADASAAEMTRYPDGLADALEKLAKHNRGDMKVSESVSHLFISDPNKTALDALYSTHPPIEERIKRLREM